VQQLIGVRARHASAIFVVYICFAIFSPKPLVSKLKQKEKQFQYFDPFYPPEQPRNSVPTYLPPDKANLASEKVYSGDSNRPVIFVVLSGSTWSQVGKQGWETWQMHVEAPNRLLIATDVPLGDDVPDSMVFFQNGTDDYNNAQRRFLDAALRIETLDNEYLFLVDDDAFVITHNVYRFLDTLQLDSVAGMIFGQATCSKLCGGGGALFTPNALKRLRSLEDELLKEYHNPETNNQWDVVLSAVLEGKEDLQLVNYEGNFNSQPPNFLQGPGKYGNPDVLHRLNTLPLTFHYVDETHQLKYNSTYHCGECPTLVPELYKQFYGHKI